MTATRRKKNIRMRGTNSHGYGHKKKHRGAGSRGGRGLAGTGKRADVKKPSLNPTTYFGKTGFTSKSTAVKHKTITIARIQDQLFSWMKSGKAKKDNKSFEINLTELGFTKLLANGKVNKPLNLHVRYASLNAVERIKSAGGRVEGLVSADNVSETGQESIKTESNLPEKD